ncbi:MAG: YdcF family protein [Rhodanobacteraceae bacterium]
MIFPVWGTSPLLYAVALLILLLVCWRWLPGAVRYAAVVVEVLLFVMTMPLGAWALSRVVLARLPPASACTAPAPDTVVVLSAGVSHPPGGATDYASLHVLSLRRLFAGVALWRTLPGARLVISGGGHRRIPDAVVMANLAGQMGVPPAGIEVEDRSRTTWQNAQFVAALSPPVPKRIWLVTSALHMPRALGAFRAWGFEPCAWPSGLQETRLHFGPWVFVPQGDAVMASTLALHELLGDVEYAVLAWQHRRHLAPVKPGARR